jgi:hypothetical protein
MGKKRRHNKKKESRNKKQASVNKKLITSSTTKPPQATPYCNLKDLTTTLNNTLQKDKLFELHSPPEYSFHKPDACSVVYLRKDSSSQAFIDLRPVRPQHKYSSQIISSYVSFVGGWLNQVFPTCSILEFSNAKIPLKESTIQKLSSLSAAQIQELCKTATGEKFLTKHFFSFNCSLQQNLLTNFNPSSVFNVVIQNPYKASFYSDFMNGGALTYIAQQATFNVLSVLYDRSSPKNKLRLLSRMSLVQKKQLIQNFYKVSYNSEISNKNYDKLPEGFLIALLCDDNNQLHPKSQQFKQALKKEKNVSKKTSNVLEAIGNL